VRLRALKGQKKEDNAREKYGGTGGTGKPHAALQPYNKGDRRQNLDDVFFMKKMAQPP
jgi:hypothetical protein